MISLSLMDVKDWYESVSSPLSLCPSDLLSSSSPSPLLSSSLSSLHPPSAVSDHWWISCVTSRARCSRERGTTPQCWPRPPRTVGRLKTSTRPSCRAKTTAVSGATKQKTNGSNYTRSSGRETWSEACPPVTWTIIVAALYSDLSSVSESVTTHRTSAGNHLLWLRSCQTLLFRDTKG